MSLDLECPGSVSRWIDYSAHFAANSRSMRRSLEQRRMRVSRLFMTFLRRRGAQRQFHRRDREYKRVQTRGVLVVKFLAPCLTLGPCRLSEGEAKEGQVKSRRFLYKFLKL